MCCPIFTKFGRYYFIHCCVGSTDLVAIGVGKAALLALAFNVKLFDILEVKNALKSIHTLADYPICSGPPGKFHHSVSISLHFPFQILPDS